MSLARLIWESLRHHWRTNLAVALAVAATTAVLTGALVVGDSMRGSLRHLLLDQLGSIDEVLVGDRFFRAELAQELSSAPAFAKDFERAVPAVIVQGTLENPKPGATRRAGNVNVFGVGEDFWKFGTTRPARLPAGGEVVLNRPLADAIGVQAGDECILRIGHRSQIPADSALGRKTDTVRNRRLKVVDVIPAEGLGRFSLHPSQITSLTAFVAPATLQDMLEQPDKVNALLVSGRPGVVPSTPAHEALEKSLTPTLADFGLKVEITPFGFAQVTSNRMLLEPAAVDAIERAFGSDRPQTVFTYLANSITAADGRTIPYSTITAIDFVAEPPLGPFTSPEGQTIAALADNEIALNTWAAADLGAKIGDSIEVTFFEPESTHGEVRERKAAFRLAAIVAMKGVAADPDLTPQMPGVTDKLTIGDWDAPFPYDSKRVRKQDEDYWDEYRTTPKAFLSLAAGQRLWTSRFGDATAIRFVPPAGATAESLAARLQLEPSKFGLQFNPVKRLGLAAASGTTPFDALFVGFSLFIMVASLLLVSLLFRLGMEQRSDEIGLLRAIGLSNRKVRQVLTGEALVVAIVGSLVGAACGVAYARLMLAGLSTWWLAAISTPFLRLYVTPRSLAIGFAAGVLVSLLTVLWGLRRTGKVSIRRLLDGQLQDARPTVRGAGRLPLVAAALVLAALGIALFATRLQGEAAAGAFVGAGALVLAAGLTWVFARFRSGATASLARPSAAPIARLAARSGARNPTRSTLSIGLIAAASFLIVALSAFRLDPSAEGRGPKSGSGGFQLIATSDQPIFQNINSRAGRDDLGFAAAEQDALAGTTVVPLRVRAGDDASCLNLYQPTQPRVLGISPALVERGGFAWAGVLADQTPANPWSLLAPAKDSDGRVPAMVDFNTATYSLKKSLGDTVEIDDEFGATVPLVIVGLLKNSIFQGDLLISEDNFKAHFPQVSGYRLFLVDAAGQPVDGVAQALEGTLGDYGFDVETTADRLAGFFAVQNTYLSTFQSLGGLGLLLGTLGLATVQLRSVLERRGELALMRASGFRRSMLARLVMIENALLLVTGLAIGVLAALVAVLPHWLSGGASVPWLSLATTLTLVLVVGLAAGLVAVEATLRAQLIPALREE